MKGFVFHNRLGIVLLGIAILLTVEYYTRQSNDGNEIIFIIVLVLLQSSFFIRRITRRYFLYFAFLKKGQIILPKFFSVTEKRKLWIESITAFTIAMWIFTLFAYSKEPYPYFFIVFVILIIVTLALMWILMPGGKLKFGHIELYDKSIFICDKDYFIGVELDIPEDRDRITVSDDHLLIRHHTGKAVRYILNFGQNKESVSYEVYFQDLSEEDNNALKEFLKLTSIN